MTSLVGGEVFVQVARGMRFDGRALTLVDLAPSTIWVRATTTTDIDYVCTGALLDRWAQAESASSTRSWQVPVTLGLLDSDAQVTDVAFVASSPRVTADGLAYDVEAVRGAAPSESGACVLFLEWGASVPVSSSAALTP